MAQLIDRTVVKTTVRPARILVLVPSAMPSWHQVMLILSNQVSLAWGGRWNVAAVPVDDDHRIPSPFIELAELFDPDYVVRLGPLLATLRDAGVDHPHIGQIAEGLRKTGLFSEDALTEILQNQVATWPQTEGPVVNQVDERLPAFDRHITRELIERQQPETFPPYPLTGIDSYLQGRMNLPPLADFKVLAGDAEVKLLAAWTLGPTPSALKTLWREGGGEIVEVPLFDKGEVDGSLELIWGSERTPYRFRSYERSLGTTVAGASPSTRGLLEGVVAVERGGGSSMLFESALAVVGDELSDFLLWLLLSRMRPYVYWIPTRYLSSRFRRRFSNPLSSFASHLTYHLEMGSRQPYLRSSRLDLTTASLRPQRLGQARLQIRRAELRADGSSSALDESLALLTPVDLVSSIKPILRVIERQGANSPAVVNLDEQGWSLAPLPSPSPASSADRALGSKRWIVEYDVGEHVPPSRRIATWMLEAGGLGPESSRITRTGKLAVMHPHFMVLGTATIDDTWSLRYRPPPQGVEMIKTLLEGEYAVDLMDKGRYFLELERRMGAELLTRLMDDEGFISLASALLGIPADSNNLVFDGTVAAVELSSAAAALDDQIDVLLGSGVLNVVHATKCPLCRNVELKRLADLQRVMHCLRCDNEIDLDAMSALEFFRTPRVSMNGVLTEFLSQRSDAVLAAFNASGFRDRMQLLPEIELKEASDKFNVDLVATGNGELVLGEVKTGRQYLSNKECRRYTRRMERIAHVIKPVRMTVVHAWTSDLSAKVPHISSPQFETISVLLPPRPWYS